MQPCYATQTLVYGLVGYIVGKLYMNVLFLSLDASLLLYLAVEEMIFPVVLARIFKECHANLHNATSSPPFFYAFTCITSLSSCTPWTVTESARCTTTCSASPTTPASGATSW